MKVHGYVWKDTTKAFRNENQESALAGISVPTLVIWGAKDDIFKKSDEERLLAAIRGSRFKEYPDAGHNIHWELPKEVANDIRDFLQ